jgi:ABC-2 type transport system permease protein
MKAARNDAPIGAARAARLIVRLQLLRMRNMLAASLDMYRRKDRSAAKTAKRTATPGKPRSGFVFGAFILLSMAFGFVNLASQAKDHIEKAMGPVWLASGGFQGVTILLLLLFGAVALMSLASRELARPDWDMEWLVTLPAPLSTLLAIRILSRTLLNVLGLLMFWPFLAIVAWDANSIALAHYGFGWRMLASAGLGLAAAFPLQLIIGAMQTLADTGLRLRLSPATLRNFQAVLAIVSVIVFYLALSVGVSSSGGMALGWASSQPDWTPWTPWGLAARAVTSLRFEEAAQPLLILTAAACVFAALVIAVLRWELRDGVVAAGARETGRREKPQAAKIRPLAESADGGNSSARKLLTPIQARELRLLSRDRTFLVQTLVLPVVIVVSQIFINSSGADPFSALAEHPERLAAVAFGIAAYGLMLSAFQTVNAEGQALWIFYTVPHRVESILWQKAVLWSVASLIYPAAIFAYIFVSGATPSPLLMELAAVAFVGAPIFAVIATSLGVFASDPLAQETHKRLRPSFVYLYMLLSSIYVYAFFANGVWQRAGLITLTGLLAYALWQKAKDHIPYLLDPAASPPARVSVSDGLVAALLFFVLQGLTVFLLMKTQEKDTADGGILLAAFAAAGAVTYALTRFHFWRLKSEGAPKIFGDPASRGASLGRAAGRAVLWGALGGLAAAAAAFVYLKLAMRTPLVEEASRTVLAGRENLAILATLAVLAAPVFEEFIFRGMIFGGLRRSAGLTPSVLASAAIFALVHPPASVIPVFGLGVATALVYERTRILLGAMTAHAAYNAVVVLALPFVL